MRLSVVGVPLLFSGLFLSGCGTASKDFTKDYFLNDYTLVELKGDKKVVAGKLRIKVVERQGLLDEGHNEVENQWVYMCVKSLLPDSEQACGHIGKSPYLYKATETQLNNYAFINLPAGPAEISLISGEDDAATIEPEGFRFNVSSDYDITYFGDIVFTYDRTKAGGDWRSVRLEVKNSEETRQHLKKLYPQATLSESFPEPNKVQNIMVRAFR